MMTLVVKLVQLEHTPTLVEQLFVILVDAVLKPIFYERIVIFVQQVLIHLMLANVNSVLRINILPILVLVSVTLVVLVLK
jgi:hypothetical protein